MSESIEIEIIHPDGRRQQAVLKPNVPNYHMAAKTLVKWFPGSGLPNLDQIAGQIAKDAIPGAVYHLEVGEWL